MDVLTCKSGYHVQRWSPTMKVAYRTLPASSCSFILPSQPNGKHVHLRFQLAKPAHFLLALSLWCPEKCNWSKMLLDSRVHHTVSPEHNMPKSPLASLLRHNMNKTKSTSSILKQPQSQITVVIVTRCLLMICLKKENMKPVLTSEQARPKQQTYHVTKDTSNITCPKLNHNCLLS